MKKKKNSHKTKHRWVYMNSWQSFTHYKFMNSNSGLMMEVAVCYDCEELFILKKIPEIKNESKKKAK